MLTRSMTKSELRAVLQGKIPVYDIFEPIQHGYFKVVQNGKKGLLNSRYQQVLQPIYETIDVVRKDIIVASRQRGVYEVFSEWGVPITNRIFTCKDDALGYASFF